MNKKKYWYCKHFSKNLADLMKMKGLTVLKLAAKMGISKNTIYNWLYGISEPSIGEARILAGVLGVTMAELIGEEDQQNDG